jgi:hypothetical protein
MTNQQERQRERIDRFIKTSTSLIRCPYCYGSCGDLYEVEHWGEYWHLSCLQDYLTANSNEVFDED